MDVKEQLAESIAEDVILDIKPYCPTDLTYLWTEEETGNVELKHTPKGQFLKERLIKTILTHLKDETNI